MHPTTEYGTRKRNTKTEPPRLQNADPEAALFMKGVQYEQQFKDQWKQRQQQQWIQ